MARFGSAAMRVTLVAAWAGAGVWSVGCKPSRSSSETAQDASQADDAAEDESSRNGAAPIPEDEPAPQAELQTNQAANLAASPPEQKTKPEATKPDGEASSDEPIEIQARDALTGQPIKGVTLRKVDPKKPRVTPPNPIPPADPNPSSIEGLKRVETESGLRYWDIKVGKGEVPHEQAMVEIDYRCWLEDGKLVDGAAQRGWYPTYVKGGPIPGLSEGIWSMREGGIRQLLVPPDLGFGATGFPRQGDQPKMIPPNAELKFEVELRKVYQPAKQTSLDGIEMQMTPSGVKYWDIKVGDGDVVKPNSEVRARFTGWRVDGTMFDTTEFAKQPRAFRLWESRVIAGWRHGVPGMRVGGKRRLEIPPELAYGSADRNPKIPPDSTLIFEIDLVATTTPPSLPTQSKVQGLKKKTTESGLIFWDIQEGEGAFPEATSTVIVHYTVWLQDGAIQDTTEMSGSPRRLPLKRLFAGMRETINTMKPGGIRQAKIPPKLAYGEKGQPPGTPPNATLLLEIQLIDFE